MSDSAAAAALVESYNRLKTALAKRIVGQEAVIEQVFIALAAGGHSLLEGVPGLAKTLLVKSLADAMHLGFRRIQFTPDLMPADITGTEIIQEDAETGRRKLVFQQGPIFSQIILFTEKWKNYQKKLLLLLSQANFIIPSIFMKDPEAHMNNCNLSLLLNLKKMDFKRSFPKIKSLKKKN
jgi:hypothetical protein